MRAAAATGCAAPAPARPPRERLEPQPRRRVRAPIPLGVALVAFLLTMVHMVARPHVLALPIVVIWMRALATAGFLAETDASVLLAAAELQLALMQVLRIALDGPLDAATATPGLKALLAKTAGVAEFDTLQRLLADLQARAHQVFERLVEAG